MWLTLSGGQLMYVAKRTSSPQVFRPTPRSSQKGWLLLAVLMVIFLIALGVVMLMSQAQLSLRSVRQGHQTLQVRINQWPPLLNNRRYIDAQ